MDPQHQAVRASVTQLKEARWGRRGEAAQDAYLDDVTELVREVTFILDQAGIAWGDIVRQVDQADDVMARVLLMDPRGTLEYALCSAVLEARGRL